MQNVFVKKVYSSRVVSYCMKRKICYNIKKEETAMKKNMKKKVFLVFLFAVARNCQFAAGY